MTENRDVNVTRLRALYGRSSLHKTFFDWLASAQRSRTKTNLDRVIALLEAQGLEVMRQDVTDILRELEETGCGVFVAGRRGRPSRFLWSHNLISVGRAASGSDEEPERLPDLPATQPRIARRTQRAETPANGEIIHSFNLRPDFRTEFSLPEDFTADEAERLAAFLRTLPFPT